MRTYEQYCPIARAAEVFAERWTPLIVRNIHAGSSTYGEILGGLPGMSHTMLTQRLRHLVRAGVVMTAPKESGFGVRYVLTDAGNELWPVLLALGAWGERWVRCVRARQSAVSALDLVHKLPRARQPSHSGVYDSGGDISNAGVVYCGFLRYPP